MLKGKKLVAVLLTFVMVMASMVTGFAFTYVGGPSTSSSSFINNGATNGGTLGDYRVVLYPQSANIGDTITLQIKILDSNGNVVTDKDVLSNFVGKFEITATSGTLVYDSNNDNIFTPNDNTLTKVTTDQATYKDVYNNSGTTIDIHIGANLDGTGFAVLGPTAGNLYNPNNYQSFYLARYGVVWVSSGPNTIVVNGKSYSVDYTFAKLFLNGLNPTVKLLSGNNDNKPLETYPETALISWPNGVYKNNGLGFAELYEDGNLIAIYSTGDNSLQAADVNNDGIVDGFKAVLPPLSSSHKYSLKVYGMVNHTDWYVAAQNYEYAAVGSVDLTPVAAKSTVVAPTDKVLAAGLDKVTFTLDDKLQNGNTRADNKNLVVDLGKYVKFTVLKSDNKTTDGDVKTIDSTYDAAKDVHNDGSIKQGVWYKVTNDGLEEALFTDTKNANGKEKYTFDKYGDPISGTYDSSTGKITVTANIPAGDFLKIEAAYTDYPANGYENYDTTNDTTTDDKSIASYGYEKTFVVADYEAKAAKLTVNKDTIEKGTSSKNIVFTLKDVHNNPIAKETLAFAAPVVAIGGSSYGSANVANTVTTDVYGQANPTIYSDQNANIDVWAKNDYLGIPQGKGVTLKVGEAAPLTVVFTPGSTTYTVNGVDKTADAAPYIASTGRTVVPARFLADALGAQSYFAYSADGHSVVTFVKGTTVVKFVLGTNQVTITKNGVTVTDTMDVTATVNDQNGKPVGRTYIPARYLAEALGYTVNYDATTGTVTVTNAQ